MTLESQLIKKIEEDAEKQADKVVGITKLAHQTFKESYKSPDSLYPLVKIQYFKGASFLLPDVLELVAALEYLKKSVEYADGEEYFVMNGLAMEKVYASLDKFYKKYGVER